MMPNGVSGSGIQAIYELPGHALGLRENTPLCANK
jgi:hypothetical protein